MSEFVGVVEGLQGGEDGWRDDGDRKEEGKKVVPRLAMMGKQKKCKNLFLLVEAEKAHQRTNSRASTESED